jgi:DivIVA domain-containing protein
MPAVPLPPKPPSHTNGSQNLWDGRNVAELSQTSFRTTLRGYDRDEVRSILESLAADYRVLQLQNASLQRQLADVEAVLEAYYQGEEPNATALAIKHTLHRANEEARAILTRAQAQAEETMSRVTALSREAERPIKQLESDRKNFQVLVADTISEMLAILSAAEGHSTDFAAPQEAAPREVVDTIVEAPIAVVASPEPAESIVSGSVSSAGPLSSAPQESTALVPISIVTRKPELRVVAPTAPPSKGTHARESIDTMLRDLDKAMLQIPSLPGESL